MTGNTDRQIVEAAVLVAMHALPNRLPVQGIAVATGVSVGSLQQAFTRSHGMTATAYILKHCLAAAHRDLDSAAPGDTVVAIIRRWGFGGDDAAFRRSYRLAYIEQPSETMRLARARIAPPTIRSSHIVPDDQVICLVCGQRLDRLRGHLATAHGLRVEDYRKRWGLPRGHRMIAPDFCRAGRRKVTGTAALDVRTKGNRKRPSTGEDLPAPQHPVDQPLALVKAAEDLVLKMLPERVDEGVLATSLNVGLRELRRAFRTARGDRPYAALHIVRLEEACRRLEADPTLMPHIAAQQCGFGYYARFWEDFVAHIGHAPNKLHSHVVTASARMPKAYRAVSAFVGESPV